MNRRRFYADLLERTIWTGIQGFAAEWLVTSSLDERSFKVAGVAALIAVAKGVVATQIGRVDSASTAPGV